MFHSIGWGSLSIYLAQVSRFIDHFLLAASAQQPAYVLLEVPEVSGCGPVELVYPKNLH